MDNSQNDSEEVDSARRRGAEMDQYYRLLLEDIEREEIELVLNSIDPLKDLKLSDR